MLKLLSIHILLVLMSAKTGCFNVDKKYPIIFGGPPRSYFGYSVVLDSSQGLFVGAPRSNYTNWRSAFEPGSLFSCNITDGGSCKEMKLKGSSSTSYSRSFTLKYRIWLGGTLEMGSRNRLLACAHRFYNPRYESASGACIAINTVTGLIMQYWNPLDDRENLYIYDREKREYRSYFANGQFGMSAAFREDREQFFVGAPGVLEGTGTDCILSTITSEEKVRSPLLIEPHSYFGYSMTRGKFYRTQKEHSAVGAPRDGNIGKVYITDNNNDGGLDFNGEILKGFELGEYFGWSVLAVDSNGDSLSDLLVGAPLYSVDTGCDEGKVYVFLSDGKEMNYFTALVGDQKADARFGTALAKVGDLNQDGFQDIAVGAPYEDGKGAVYIYLGAETGIKDEYSQKIEANKINPDLSGFGIHISRGEDVDRNGYPDFAVGSYLSSNVVLLRSLPVIEVSLDFFFNPPSIKMDKAECLYENKNLPCIHIDVCLYYTGKEVQLPLDFQCSVIEDDPNPRGFFFPYRYKNAAAERNQTVKSNITTCFTLQFYLPSDIKDIVTPVPISLSCDLATLDLDTHTDPSYHDYFSYPVVSPWSILNITKSLPFHSGCESEECRSDLVLAAELESAGNGSAITLGEVTSVTLDVTVRNDGEPAFLAQLLIYLPPEVPVIRMDFCEAASGGIKCELGNPLGKDKMVGFQIKLDVSRIPPRTKEVEIALESTTNSTEVNPEDNVAILTLLVQTETDIGIRGIPSHSLILYHETEEISSTIKHKFTVRNHGPSPIHSINLLLEVPNAIYGSNGRTEFLFFTGLQTDSRSEMTVSSACNSNHMNTEWFIPFVTLPPEADVENGTFVYENDSFASNFVNKRDLGRNRQESFHSQPDSRRDKTSWKDERENHVLSCARENVRCVSINCSSSPFTDLRKFAEVSVSFQIDYRVLRNHFESWSQIELISTASILSPDNDIVIFHRPKISRVKTVLLDMRYASRDVPQWLYFTSFFIGLMLLLQVLFVLIKVGFFKRKEKMALNRLKQSFSEADLDKELLIDPSENDDLTDENSGDDKE